jgi:hypothetical protein
MIFYKNNAYQGGPAAFKKTGEILPGVGRTIIQPGVIPGGR